MSLKLFEANVKHKKQRAKQIFIRSHRTCVSSPFHRTRPNVTPSVARGGKPYVLHRCSHSDANYTHRAKGGCDAPRYPAISRASHLFIFPPKLIGSPSCDIAAPRTFIIASNRDYIREGEACELQINLCK